MTGPAGTRRNKPATRRTLLARRDGLTERERADKSRVICERAAEVVAKRCASRSMIALYAHKGTEVATAALDDLLRATEFRIAYPRVVDESRVLAFHEVAVSELGVSRWDLREPTPDAAAVVLEEIAAFVVPGLAFDRTGARLGWGKGHYDATLGAARAANPDVVTIGLAFECQVVDNVPRENHDVALGVIITEVATLVAG